MVSGYKRSLFVFFIINLFVLFFTTTHFMHEMREIFGEGDGEMKPVFFFMTWTESSLFDILMQSKAEQE
jgi:hypothetical protein